MIVHEMQQQTDEWFEVKKGKFSASDATAIQANGKGLDTLVFKKVAEILGGNDEDRYTNADMERGNETEDIARTAYELATGNMVKQVGFIENDEQTYGCSPDGLVGEDGLVEFKCQRGYKYIEIAYANKIGKGKDAIDKTYLDQMQMQMLVTGRKWCDYVSYNEDIDTPIIIRIDADPEVHAKLQRGLVSGVKKVKEMVEALQ